MNCHFRSSPLWSSEAGGSCSKEPCVEIGRGESQRLNCKQTYTTNFLGSSWVGSNSPPCLASFSSVVKTMHSSSSQVLRIFCLRLRDLKNIILKVLRRSVTEKETNRVYSNPFKRRWHDNNFSVSGSSQKQSFQNCLHLVFLVSSSFFTLGPLFPPPQPSCCPQGVLCICRARAGIQSGWLVSRARYELKVTAQWLFLCSKEVFGYLSL